MSDVTFSLLHASRGRPAKAVAAMQSVFANAARPRAIDYVVAVNDDDAETMAAFDKLAAMIVFGPFRGSSSAWDAAAKMSRGEILIQMSDDLELPPKFDDLLLAECEKQAGKKWNDRPAYIAVSDGFRKDSLCTCAVMNRRYYELAGCFTPPQYASVYSDGEVTFRAMERSRRGEATFIDARAITFLHRHHYNDKSVPWDATYERGNSSEAYREGQRLFFERNPEATKPGLVDWL